MRLLILGATGNSGLALTRMALDRGHSVAAYVRDPAKLSALLGAQASDPDLSVRVGTVNDTEKLAHAMQGQDVVINAAGNATVDSDYVAMVRSIIEIADESLGSSGRFWFFGGAAALDVPGMTLRAADIPVLPVQFRQHLHTLACAEASSLDWSMLCPGPMNGSQTGKPRAELRVSKDCWPVEGPGPIRLFKSVRVLAAFKQRMPEMIITYEDAAKVILDNLGDKSVFSRRRVGVALPIGETGSKSLRS